MKINLKPVWRFIEKVAWPFARDKFICASREEAEEIVHAWRRSQVKNDLGLSPDPIPAFVLRCIEWIESEE